jgi:hypothetical protein
MVAYLLASPAGASSERGEKTLGRRAGPMLSVALWIDSIDANFWPCNASTVLARWVTTMRVMRDDDVSEAARSEPMAICRHERLDARQWFSADVQNVAGPSGAERFTCFRIMHDVVSPVGGCFSLASHSKAVKHLYGGFDETMKH